MKLFIVLIFCLVLCGVGVFAGYLVAKDEETDGSNKTFWRWFSIIIGGGIGLVCSMVLVWLWNQSQNPSISDLNRQKQQHPNSPIVDRHGRQSRILTNASDVDLANRISLIHSLNTR